MKLSCTKENLAKGVAIASRVAGVRGTLPVLGNLLLATEKGRLKIAATDLEIAIITYIGAKVEAEGSITVPARLLLEFVSENPDEMIELSTEGTRVKATSSRVSAHLNGIDAGDFPLIPEIGSGEALKVKASELKTAIAQVVFAAASDETRPILTGVLLSTEGKKLRLAATDSYRLAEKVIDLTQPASQTKSVVVPSRTLAEINRLIDGTNEDAEIVAAENQISFNLNSVKVVSRILEGSFPDYEQIIPKEKNTTALVKTVDLQNALRLGTTFSRDIANNIRLTFNKESKGGELSVVATSPSTGDITTKIESKVSGEKIEIAFNARFLLDVVSAVNSAQVELAFKSNFSAVVVSPSESRDYRALVMPLKLDNQ